MASLTRETVRSLLNIQDFDPPDPEFSEVFHRINALIEGLKGLDELDIFHVEPWSVLPFRGFSKRLSENQLGAKETVLSNAESDIAFMTIRQQADLIRSRKLSPSELIRTYLDRIEKYDPHLHSFNLVMREQAIQEAQRAEIEIGSGNYRGLMHGIPIAVKDQLNVKGYPNTGGCDAYKDNVADQDCTIIHRFREAGAVILGTLATHEFHMGGTLEFITKYSPRNPWDLQKSPAGSSAGSGASVAAGLVSGSIGGDTGGSIRGPGSVNGIVGLRPSWGRLSRQGIFTLSWEMDTAGPLARSAEDTAIMLGTIAGYDPGDPTTSSLPVPDYLEYLGSGIKGIRVGVVEEMMGDRVEAETRMIVAKAIKVLEELGATIEPVSIPLMKKMQGVHTAICDGQAASYHRRHLRERYFDYDYNTRVRLLVGSLIPAGLQTLAMRARAFMGQTLLDYFDTFDVLVGSTGQGPAGPIVTESPFSDMEGARGFVMDRAVGTGAFSMAGAAAISIPAGFTEDGLPVGWHLATRPMDETTLFTVCHAFQQVTDHHQHHPEMQWGTPG